MRGVPNNPVPCRKCGDPNGFPRIGLCKNCRPPSVRKKYFWTSFQDDDLRRIYAQHVHNKRQLADALTDLASRLGWPKYIVKNRAAQLRLCVDIRRAWTPREIVFLREHAGTKSVSYMMKLLGRGYNSVTFMMARAGLSWRLTEGYSRQDLSTVFGVSLQTVRMWIKRRWLVPSRETDRVSENQVRKFIRLHAEEYSFKRVDEAWLKGMIFESFGRVERVSRTEHSEVA